MMPILSVFMILLITLVFRFSISSREASIGEQARASDVAGFGTRQVGYLTNGGNYYERDITREKQSAGARAFDTLFNKRDYAAAEKYWSPNYIQHSAHIE